MWRCMYIGMCMCVQCFHMVMGMCERESKHMLWCCTSVCLCVSESLSSGVHEHVCVHERECMSRCMHMGMCVCVCGHICRAPPGRMRPGIQSGLCLLAWGGKQGLLLDSLGMSWGCHGASGAHRPQGTLDCGPPMAPQKHGRDWLDPRAAEGAVTPGTPPVSWPSAGTASLGVHPSQEQSRGSLGAWMSQVNRQGTAKGDGRTGVSVYLFPYNPLPTSQQGQLDAL